MQHNFPHSIYINNTVKTAYPPVRDPITVQPNIRKLFKKNGRSVYT